MLCGSSACTLVGCLLLATPCLSVVLECSRIIPSSTTHIKSSFSHFRLPKVIEACCSRECIEVKDSRITHRNHQIHLHFNSQSILILTMAIYLNPATTVSTTIFGTWMIYRFRNSQISKPNPILPVDNSPALHTARSSPEILRRPAPAWMGSSILTVMRPCFSTPSSPLSSM